MFFNVLFYFIHRMARCLWSTESDPTARRWRWATSSRKARTARADPVQRATPPATKPEVPPGLRPRPPRCRAPPHPPSPRTRSSRTAPTTSTGPLPLPLPPPPPPLRPPAAPSPSSSAASPPPNPGRFLWTARRLPPDDAGLRTGSDPPTPDTRSADTVSMPT